MCLCACVRVWICVCVHVWISPPRPPQPSSRTLSHHPPPFPPPSSPGSSRKVLKVEIRRTPSASKVCSGWRLKFTLRSSLCVIPLFRFRFRFRFKCRCKFEGRHLPNITANSNCSLVSYLHIYYISDNNNFFSLPHVLANNAGLQAGVGPLAAVIENVLL